MTKASNTKLSANEWNITYLSVSGYKSLQREQGVEIRPFTILAGANSSGKSSLMQPLLLQKQTIEATYDPGALLLNGPNVRFTSTEQMCSKIGKDGRSEIFSVGVMVGSQGLFSCSYKRGPSKRIDIDSTQFQIEGGKPFTLTPELSSDELKTIIDQSEFLRRRLQPDLYEQAIWTVVRDRCFLELGWGRRYSDYIVPPLMSFSLCFGAEDAIRKVIHVPGLRGNPERTYPVTAVESAFPGTFEKYTASVIAQWQATDRAILDDLGNDLRKLGLTWKVAARPIDDTQVEIQVARLPQATRGGAGDLVSIADVGFGLSQTLPVLVALRAAKPGQLVYLEQPEIHLHPRAQTLMAEVIADAAKRGVRVVVETHSALLILGVQTLVAEGKLAPELVKLHWFKRQADGATEITSANLDDAGAFGDWPEDFAEIALEAESRFLDAADAKRS